MSIELRPQKERELEKKQQEVQELVDTLTQPYSPEKFVGLPHYRLRQISEKNPAWFLEKASTTPSEFIELCRLFEHRFSVGQLKQLKVETDPFKQGRITEAISRAIIRGGLDERRVLNGVDQRWKNEISTKVREYVLGEVKFDGLKPQDLFPNNQQ